jgi:hypothetical protein
MAAKDVKFNTDARDRMLRGVNVLARQHRDAPQPEPFRARSGHQSLRDPTRRAKPQLVAGQLPSEPDSPREKPRQNRPSSHAAQL